MQLTNFKYYISKVISEGNRLQKYDVNGKQLIIKWYSSSQNISFALATIAIILLPKGFTDNFSGYTISFLGIFIGLFTSIIISMYDKSKNLMSEYVKEQQENKVIVLQVRNYLVQFTGLTAYGVLLALVVIVLLWVSLADEGTKTNIQNFEFITSCKNVHFVNIFYFLKASMLIIHRFITVYLLVNFLFITIFSTTSYFTFLLSEYKKLKINK